MGISHGPSSAETADSMHSRREGRHCAEVDTCCGCCGVQEGVQVMAITSIVNGFLRMLPSIGGKGDLYVAGLVLGALQVMFGIYGYYGAEQLSGFKVRIYLVWTVVALALSMSYLAASYSMADAFCAEHNCEKASEGFCTVDVCEVIEDHAGRDQYYKLPCLVEDGKPNHDLCVTAVKQDVIVEMLLVLPLSLYYVVVVWSLHSKIGRGVAEQCAGPPVPYVHVAPPAYEPATSAYAPAYSISDEKDEKDGLLHDDLEDRAPVAVDAEQEPHSYEEREASI